MIHVWDYETLQQYTTYSNKALYTWLTLSLLLPHFIYVLYVYTHTLSLPFASPLCLYASPLSLPNHQWRWQQKNRRKRRKRRRRRRKRRRRRRRKGPLRNFGLKVKDMDGNQWINYLRVGWQNGMMVTAGVCRSCLAMRNFKQVVVVQSTDLKQTQWHTQC